MKKFKKIITMVLAIAMCCINSVPVMAAETNYEDAVEVVTADSDDSIVSPRAVGPGDCVGSGTNYGTNRIDVYVNVSQFSMDGYVFRGMVGNGTGTYDCYVTTPNGNIFLIGSNISCAGGKTNYFKTPNYQSTGTYKFTFYISNSDFVACLGFVYTPYFY